MQFDGPGSVLLGWRENQDSIIREPTRAILRNLGADIEMKLGDNAMVSEPTRRLADNNTANGWAGGQMLKVANANV